MQPDFHSGYQMSSQKTGFHCQKQNLSQRISLTMQTRGGIFDMWDYHGVKLMYSYYEATETRVLTMEHQLTRLVFRA